jgi:hypothetical protein
VDEIAGLIVEQLAKSARQAAQRRGGGPIPAPPARRPPPGRAPVPPATAPAPVAAAAPPAASPAPAAAPAFAGVDASNPFGGALVAASDLLPSTGATDEPLLRPFAGGTPFLAAFVLAEALGPPVALKEPRDF